MLKFFNQLVCSLFVLTLISVNSYALRLSGTLITEYVDREISHGGIALPTLVQGLDQGRFQVSQASVNLYHDLSTYNKFGATLTSAGGTFTISEAYLKFGGLPYDGDITIGRFYKPLGEPLMHAGLSYPALLFHTAAVIGAKMNMEYYPWRWELGFVNQNAFSTTGSLISGSVAFGRPTQNAFATHLKEAYLFLGWRDGGTWGSLDVNATYSFGRLPQADINTINTFLGGTLGLGYPPPGSNDTNRDLIDVAIDYTYGPWRVAGEYAVANEGKLWYSAWNVQGAYRWSKYALTLGYDRLDNHLSSRIINHAASWERERISYGVEWEYHPQLKFQMLYEDNNEEQLTIKQDEIRNNAFVFQMTAGF